MRLKPFTGTVREAHWGPGTGLSERALRFVAGPGFAPRELRWASEATLRARRRARLAEMSSGHLCVTRGVHDAREWKPGSSLICPTCEDVFAGPEPGQE